MIFEKGLSVNRYEFQRWQLELAQRAKTLAEGDPDVGTCDICGDNLGYLMAAEEVYQPISSIQPRLDRKQKPKPNEGAYAWPIIEGPESQCCAECDIIEVQPAKLAVRPDNRNRLH